MKTLRELKALQALDNEIKMRINIVVGALIAGHHDKETAKQKINEILDEYEQKK